MECKKNKLRETEKNAGYQALGGGGVNEETLLKGYKLPVIR